MIRLAQACCIALLMTPYLWSAVLFKPSNFGQLTNEMRSKRFPFPALMLVAAMLLEIGGTAGLIVAVAFDIAWLRVVLSLCLAGFTLVSAVLFHDFWAFEGPERLGQLVSFVKNIGLTGAFLLIALITA